MTEASFFKLITQQFDDALPFVAYRKPESKYLHSFYQEEDTVHHIKDFTESGFAFAPFDNAQKASLIPDTHHIQCEYGTASISQNASDIVLPEEEVFQRNAHIELVQKAIAKIQEGVLKKVVLSRKRTFQNSLSNPIAVFKKLLQTYPTAFVYVFYHPKIGLWLGATPETLLEVKNRTVYTMSLAGTLKYAPDAAVSWGSKEKEEQQLVTDTIASRLKPLTKDLVVGKTENHLAGNLLHLKTVISASLDESNVSLQDVITALHPTPAVCGLPVEEAKTFIIEYENYDRSYYTGFLGELNLKSETNRSKTRRNVENLAYRSVKKNTHLFVNLRCMESTSTGTQVYVGGGITAASIPEAEWEETQYKLQTMGKVLF
ncbi:chorismate-binding protein [uncultured Dokdonia sp.]|mgnify:CR=1 FL=1|uniref:chorismate-binding protein n=1 Tax=uncultured Dokdonia sp. TaxID=575653 RepID=UPI00260DC8A7|nr:chorismate-binding protein [uncultured Dokdonia sp.]